MFYESEEGTDEFPRRSFFPPTPISHTQTKWEATVTATAPPHLRSLARLVARARGRRRARAGAARTTTLCHSHTHEAATATTARTQPRRRGRIRDRTCLANTRGIELPPRTARRDAGRTRGRSRRPVGPISGLPCHIRLLRDGQRRVATAAVAARRPCVSTLPSRLWSARAWARGAVSSRGCRAAAAKQLVGARRVFSGHGTASAARAVRPRPCGRRPRPVSGAGTCRPCRGAAVDDAAPAAEAQ
jgi:hypothetical protein